MALRYKLRAVLNGHEKDVRGVCPAYFPEGSILSCSRDVSTRVWTPTGQGSELMEGHVMSGHNNFVSCVCVMPPTDTYPHGLIMTGSHDKNIHAYTLESPKPVFTLSGHSNTVCGLAAGKFGSLLSASWDMTAKVWLNDKCVMTLSGHEAAVWSVAVMPEGGFMLTGSADKLIKLWRAGKCELTFRGHTDCVRALAVLSQVEFLSCSNDTTIRRWSTTGDCIQVYTGHEAFVYSLAIMPNGVDFVSGGEDRCLKVWKAGECVQTVAHPTQSVWSVCVLPSGDIVSGASDGAVRVFTMAEERMADSEQQTLYEEQVAASSIPAQIGDMDTSQLPGAEALYNPGRRDGQTLMIRNDNHIEAYQWDAAGGKWVKIGDVTGGKSDKTEAGKTMYNGKEYDFVFTVELDEGQPALKLPFNHGDDPYMAAHTFLQDNDLTPLYLDTVAKHIMDQIKDVTIGPMVQCKDPLTELDNKDPMTGDCPDLPDASASAEHVEQYYPEKNICLFDTAKITAILGKLREFNQKVDEVQKLNENVLESLEAMMNAESAVSATQLQCLCTALNWPHHLLFPAIDVLRLSVRWPTANQLLCEEKLMQLLLGWLRDSSVPESVYSLTIRTLSNFASHPAGRTLLLQHRSDVFAAITTLHANKKLQVAIATLLLNYAVLTTGSADAEAIASILNTAATIWPEISELEATYRLLVAVGTCTSDNQNACELAKSYGLVKFVSGCRKIKEPRKVSMCARELTNMLLL